MQWKFYKTVTYTGGNEIPFDIDALMGLVQPHQPENEWQALMEAPPFVEPTEPKSIFNELRDVIDECREMMLPQDQFIVSAVNDEQISYEQLGCRLGCSAPHAWRLKQIAYKKLEEILTIDGRIFKMARHLNDE